MKDTIQKARRWLIRKLGGYPDDPMPRFIKIQAETRRMEHLRSKLIWDMAMGEPDIDIVRHDLARNLAEYITAKMRVKHELEPKWGVIHFYTEMWVTFDPPEGQEDL